MVRKLGWADTNACQFLPCYSSNPRCMGGQTFETGGQKQATEWEANPLGPTLPILQQLSGASYLLYLKLFDEILQAFLTSKLQLGVGHGILIPMCVNLMWRATESFLWNCLSHSLQENPVGIPESKSTLGSMSLSREGANVLLAPFIPARLELAVVRRWLQSLDQVCWEPTTLLIKFKNYLKIYSWCFCLRKWPNTK